MKKYILGLLLMISTLTSYAKCDLKNINFEQFNEGTTFTWYLGATDSSKCTNWMYTIYDLQTKETRILPPVLNYSGYTSYKFPKKGKYRMYLHVWDTCNKCDTFIMRDIELQYFNNVKTQEINYGCDRRLFVMTKATTYDTCYEYIHYVYTGKSYFNNPFLMTKAQWDTIKNETIWQLYALPELPAFEIEAEHYGRRFDCTFENKRYRYFVVSQCYNKCNNQDTLYGRKVTTTCGNDTTLSVATFTKPELKIIGIYDLLGRQVDYMEPNIVYIILYNNGKRQKVFKTK